MPQLVSRAWLKSLVLPPAYPEAIGDMATRRSTRIKTFFVLTAIVLDFAIVWLLRGQAGINYEAVKLFAVMNIPALMLDVAVGELAIRFARTQRAWRFVLDLSAIVLASTTAIWIQMTGSLTSYFLLCSVGLIITVRLAYDYRTAALITICFVLLHLGMVVAERMGWLRPESLFLAPPGGVYGSTRLAFLIAYSIAFTYGFSFMSVNHGVNRLREKDIALAAAQREAARAGKIGDGRLSGRTIVNRYEMGPLLGRGGMGEVYRARQLADGAEVAIKVLHPHLATQPHAIERFHREAKAASQLGGAHVARVLDAGISDGNEPFLVMERLQGENLSERLRVKGTLPLSEVIDLAREIAIGLDAAHAAGIVHRDLKPQNVFLTDDGRVVLLDFGISKMKTSDTTLTEDADVLGSPGYMAPEQARGHIDLIGPASDVFALGAIIYRTLTGRAAFGAADVVAALYQVCNSEPAAPSALVPDLPSAIDEVIARAIAKQPESRFARASDFAQALATAAGPKAA